MEAWFRSQGRVTRGQKATRGTLGLVTAGGEARCLSPMKNPSFLPGVPGMVDLAFVLQAPVPVWGPKPVVILQW